MKEHRNISIADQIFEQLEREILSGKYRRGEILSELRLSKELDVSRTPIREALLRLEQENILAETGRGMEVIGISAEDMLDLYDIRLHLSRLPVSCSALYLLREQGLYRCFDENPQEDDQVSYGIGQQAEQSAAVERRAYGNLSGVGGS